MTLHRFILLSSAFAALACGPSVASNVRQEPQSMNDAMGAKCGEVPAPWVIDLPDAEANQLEREMKSGKLVLVNYDCKVLTPVRGCDVALGDYDYGGLEYEAKHREMLDSDEAGLALSGGPAFNATLKAEFAQGAVFRLDYAAAGRLATTTEIVTRDMLKGDKARCDKATHFVAAMDLGAYVLTSGAAAKIGMAAEIFGRGGKAGSNSEVKNQAQGGEPENCKKAGEDDKEGPAGCKVPLLVQLYPIDPPSAGERAATPPPRPPPGSYRPTCPSGRVVAENGACQPKSKAKNYICTPGDVSDCRAQCAADNAPSCAILGRMLEKGEGTVEDMKGAGVAYGKACDKGISEGCTGLAYVWSKSDDASLKAKSTETFKKGCAKGDGRACSGLGQQARIRKDYDEALVQFEKGCKKGYARACFYAANILNRQNKDEGKATSLFKKACAGSDDRGCLAVGNYLQAEGEKSDAAKLIASAVKHLTADCDQKKAESCEVLGDFFNGRYGKGSVAGEKAAGFYEKACAGGQEDACLEVATIFEKGTGGAKPNPEKAKEYFGKACDKGLDAACSKVGRKAPAPPGAAGPPGGSKKPYCNDKGKPIGTLKPGQRCP
jgi:TPR repeat protein